MGDLIASEADLSRAVMDGQVSRIEAILQSNPKIRKALNKPEADNGWTQIFRAVYFGQPDSVFALRKYGARVDVKCGKGNAKGETPIGIAKKGDFDINIVFGKKSEELENLKAEMLKALRCRINPVLKATKR